MFQVDVPVKYLSFFLDDDEELATIKEVGRSLCVFFFVSIVSWTLTRFVLFFRSTGRAGC